MKLLRLLCLSTLLLQGCNIINPKEDVPSYIYLNQYKFKTDTVYHGTAIQKFTDVWISADGTNLGGYEIPATVPVLAKGPTRIQISAGVQQNGLSTARAVYPFTTTYDTMVNLGEKMIDTIHPVFNYIAGTRFEWLENFNGTNPAVTLTPKSLPYHMTYAKDSALEGGSLSAHLTVDSTKAFEIRSTNSYTLPIGQPVYLEMNYNTEVPIEVGVYAINSTQITKIDIIGLNATKHWNKAYISLGESVSAQPSGTVFAVYINAVNSGSDKGKVIMLDNLKLLDVE
jgi:hypothetical protein